MATPGLCTVAKLMFLKSMEADDLYVALYDKSADIGPNTDTYVAHGEVAGAGYVHGGQMLSGVEIGTTASTAWMTWREPVRWENATIRAAYALIYNRSKQNMALAVLSFGGEVVSTNGPWVLEFPATGGTVRIA